MTARLYYNDPALHEFRSVVQEVVPSSAEQPRAGVVLETTAFYPTSGGTYSVDHKGALYGEVVLQYAPTGLRGGSLRAFGGLVDTRTQTAYGVVRTFVQQGSDTSTDIGVTAGAGFNVPIPAFSGFSVTGVELAADEVA